MLGASSLKQGFVAARTEVLSNHHAVGPFALSKLKEFGQMIRKPASLFLLLIAFAICASGQQPSPSPAAPQPAPPKTHLKVGQPAPEFVLTDTEGKELKLSDFKNKKNVVLAFYVLAFTGG